MLLLSLLQGISVHAIIYVSKHVHARKMLNTSKLLFAKHSSKGFCDIINMLYYVMLYV